MKKRLACLVPLVLAGCVVQIGPVTPAATGSPTVKTSATPKPNGTPAPGSCSKVFTYVDQDKDGKVTEQEYVARMGAIFDRMYPEDGHYSSCGRPYPDLERGFATTDLDHDGAVTRDEFVLECERAPDFTSFVPRPFLSAQAAHDQFVQGDADGDGAWDLAELEKLWGNTLPYGQGTVPDAEMVFHLACSPMAQPGARTWMAAFDDDGDGRITEAELTPYLTGTKIIEGYPTPRPTASASPTPSPTPIPTVTPTPGPNDL